MSHKLMFLLAALTLGVAGIAQAADAPQWVQGEDYVVLDPALPTSHPDQVVVTEVFSYLCPHCAHFQPYAKQLQASLPDGVVYVYKPAVFHSSWEPFARAAFTAKAMGVLEESGQALFDALHRDRKPIRTLQDLGQFYAQFGVDPAEFVSTAESFVITNQVEQAVRWERDAGVRGTPSIIVNGKYRISTNKAGGFENMVKLARYLVNKELAARDQAD